MVDIPKAFQTLKNVSCFYSFMKDTVVDRLKDWNKEKKDGGQMRKTFRPWA